MFNNVVTVYIWNEKLNCNIIKCFNLNDFATLKRTDIKISDLELSNVVKIDIPDGVIKIEDDLLNKCNLIELQIPRSVRKLDSNRLFLNFNLRNLAVPIEIENFNWTDYFYRMFFGVNKNMDFNLTLYYNDEKELLWYLKSFFKVKTKEVFLLRCKIDFRNRFYLTLQGPTLNNTRRERIEKLLTINNVENFEFIIEKEKRSYKTKCRKK